MKKIIIGLFAICNIAFCKEFAMIQISEDSAKYKVKISSMSKIAADIAINPIKAKEDYGSVYVKDEVRYVEQNLFIQDLYFVKLKSGAELVVDTDKERYVAKYLKPGDKIEFIAENISKGLDCININSFAMIKINGKNVTEYHSVELVKE